MAGSCNVVSNTSSTLDIDYDLIYTDRALYDNAVASNGGTTVLLAPANAALAFTRATMWLDSQLGLYMTQRNDPSVVIPKGILVDLTDPGALVLLPTNAKDFIVVDGVGFGHDFWTPFTGILAGTASLVSTYHCVETAGTIVPPECIQHLVSVTVRWVGRLVFFGPKTAVPPGQPARYLGKRRWVVGFEIPLLGEGGSGQGDRSNRDASRTADGMGFAYRGAANIGYVVNTTPGGATPLPRISWERFYIRLRTLPSGGEDNIWSAKGSIESGKAALINVTAGGSLTAYSKGNAAYPGSAMGTSAALTVGVWYRVDIRLEFGLPAPPPTTGFLVLYLNGVLQFAGVTVADGLAVVQLHTTSTIGADSTATTHGLEADIDDWIGADEVNIGTSRYPGFDLDSGSHVQLVRPTGFGSSQGVGWTGDWRSLNGIPHNSLSTSVVTGATPSAVIDVTTDYVDHHNGCAAFVVGAYNVAAPTGAGQIGWAIAGAASLQPFTHAAGVWSATQTPYTVATGAVANALPPIASLNLRFQANAGAGTSSVQALFAAAEIIGSFGPEDSSVPGLVFPPFEGIHNGPYTTLPLSTRPSGAVYVASGIYIGNNLGQDVLEQLNAHWWWVRPLSTTVDGVAWYSSMLAAHGYLAKGFAADRMTQALIAPGANPAMRIAGPSLQANVNAGSYQWIAVSDPVMRFVINGAFAHKSTVASAVNALVDSGFTPDAAFMFVEQFSGAASGHYYKGVGHATDTASLLDTAVASGVASFGTGAITSKTPLHTDIPGTAFSAWRRNDGSGADQWFDVVSYTGNGAGGTRNIAVSIQGAFPLFALVVPHNGVSYFRDPSHTGVNSRSITVATDVTTAIVGGGVNFITVGTTLNANAVVYDVFVIGSFTGGTGPGGVTWGNNLADQFGNVVAFTPAVLAPAPSTGPFPAPPGPAPILDAGCISFVQALSELANRLGDLGGVHWTSAELQLYLIEALRVFNALTQYYKGRGTFVAANATPFYDLSVQLATLRGYTIKDRDLITLLEYHLLEPPTPTTWTGTSMFTLDGLTQVLQRKLDHFLWETGMVLTRETAAVTPDANGRVALVADDITVRRAAWSSGGTTYPLLRDDEWGQNQYARSWPTPVAAGPMTPLAYSVGATPPLTLQLAPPPTVIGTLDVIASVRGALLNPAAGVLLGIPDDYAWVIKFGALRDLLSAPGPANDPLRAQIASTLWDQGIAAAKRSSVVIDGRINNVIARIGSLNEADFYRRNWQVGTDTPKTILLAGNNLIALAPVPDALGPYTIALNVIRNIPIPVLFTDCFFEGGAALTEVLLDYAQFLALYKEGPSQAQEGMLLLQRFLAACGITIAIDQASEPQRDATMGQTRQAERAVPREVEPVETTT